MPTAEKERLGNPGKRALNKREPVPDGQAIAPDYLDDYALEVWTRTVTAMPPGIYTTVDAPLLAAFCVAVSIHRKATMKLKRFNPVNQRKQKLSPWYRVMTEQAKSIATLGNHLGLSPTARTAIMVPRGGPTEKPAKPKKPAGKFGHLRRLESG